MGLVGGFRQANVATSRIGKETKERKKAAGHSVTEGE